MPTTEVVSVAEDERHVEPVQVVSISRLPLVGKNDRPTYLVLHRGMFVSYVYQMPLKVYHTMAL